jgi:hypothetical protein
MDFDVSKRESRDKTLENLKDSLLKKQMSPTFSSTSIVHMSSTNTSRVGPPILKEESPLKF